MAEESPITSKPDAPATSAVSIVPVPSDEEAAALVVGLSVLLSGAAPPAPAPRPPVWRWSGRWWAPRPIAADRRRPWS